MVDRNNDILSALKELEKFADSILCCKLFAHNIAENDKELWECILKFILYLSIRQHILFKGSIPDIYRHLCSNINFYPQDIFNNNTQVTIRRT